MENNVLVTATFGCCSWHCFCVVVSVTVVFSGGMLTVRGPAWLKKKCSEKPVVALKCRYYEDDWSVPRFVDPHHE